MSDFPRVQKIASLVVVTAVVILTLVAVNVTGNDADSGAAGEPTPGPDVNPTAVPILQRPRTTWAEATASIRGTADTTAPVACPLVDERERQGNNFLSLTPALTFVCDTRGLQANAIAPGRIVMKVTQAPLNSEKAMLVANGKDGPWVRAAAYGSFVAVDHGAIDGVGNVTSIYAGLEAVNADLDIGQLVDTTTPLGRIGALTINGELVAGVLTFELLTDDTRFGADPLRSDPAPASAAATQATLLADVINMPVGAGCQLPFGNPELNVGASRDYRSGTHNGLDFNCGSIDNDVAAAADGEVLFVVNDYLDATVDDRDAVLDNAAQAVDTPFWSLAMLYGRFVVVAHHLPGNDDQIVTIYAHLSEVDPNIVTGRILYAGSRIGAVGNTGTSAASAGIDNNHMSVHLHWELHVNDRPVGYLSAPSDTEPLYQQMLCTPALVGSGC